MYRERPSRVDGAVVWTSTPGDRSTLVLPDGCTDIIWWGGRLVVAGPDTTARESGPTGRETVGIRFASGVGPTVLGTPAVELRDQLVPLEDAWPADAVARLLAAIEGGADPAAALEDAVLGRLRATGPPPEGDRAAARLLADGTPVADVADALGVTSRQLHRRSLAAFGYGPKLLARILRFGRALERVRAGVPPATAAAECGYADQSHLSHDARDLAGRTLGDLVDQSGANRSTPLPSGSRNDA
jgi:AraC-like DNA-binding protein